MRGGLTAQLAFRPVGIFFYAAVLTALWAVALTVLGLRHPRFPGGEGGARIIAVVSILLAGAGVATAVITGMEEEHEKEAEARANAAEAPPPDPGSIRVEANPQGQLRFERDRLETTAGTRTLELTNSSPLPHNIAVVGQGVDVVGPTVPRGGTSRVTVALRPGRYTFYCSVLGHREGGMEGTLLVR